MQKKSGNNKKWLDYMAVVKSQYPKLDKYERQQKASEGYQKCKSLVDLEEQKKCFERGIPPRKRVKKLPPLPVFEEPDLPPIPKKKTRIENLTHGRNLWDEYVKRVRAEYPELTYREIQQFAKIERQKCNKITDPNEREKCYQSGFKKKIIEDLTKKVEAVIEAANDVPVSDFNSAQELQSDVNSVISTFPAVVDITSGEPLEWKDEKTEKFLNKLEDLYNSLMNSDITEGNKDTFDSIFSEIKTDIDEIVKLDIPIPISQYEIRKSKYFNEEPKLQYTEQDVEQNIEPDVEQYTEPETHTITNTPFETTHEHKTKGIVTYKDKGHSKIDAGHTIINIYNYANGGVGGIPHDVARTALSVNAQPEHIQQHVGERLERIVKNIHSGGPPAPPFSGGPPAPPFARSPPMQKQSSEQSSTPGVFVPTPDDLKRVLGKLKKISPRQIHKAVIEELPDLPEEELPNLPEEEMPELPEDKREREIYEYLKNKREILKPKKMGISTMNESSLGEALLNLPKSRRRIERRLEKIRKVQEISTDNPFGILEEE